MASSPRIRRRSNNGPRAVLGSGWRRRIPVNTVMRHELVRKEKGRLDDFGNVTRSLETILREWRSNEFDELNSVAAVRARGHGGSAHKSHSGFERARWKRRGA
jgi:hypothetical protein